MKSKVVALTTCVFLLTLSGCEKARQTVDAADKVKTFSDGLQKKASNKLDEVLPGFAKKPSKGEDKDSDHKEEKDKDD